MDEEGGNDQPTQGRIVSDLSNLVLLCAQIRVHYQMQALQDFVKSDDSNVDYVFICERTQCGVFPFFKKKSYSFVQLSDVGHAHQSDAKSEKELQEEEDGKSECELRY